MAPVNLISDHSDLNLDKAMKVNSPDKNAPIKYKWLADIQMNDQQAFDAFK